MRGLELYEWIAGSKHDFIKNFEGNDPLYKRAGVFWELLESYALFIICTFVILGILFAFLYYGPFNNKPGRHYRPRWWAGFLGITFAATLIVTLIIGLLANPELSGSGVLIFKIALGNALYAMFVYFLTSVVWCNLIPTNAYPIFKFKKKK